MAFSFDPYDESLVQVHNPHIDQMETDALYHLALDTKIHDLPAMFGDIKFICMGGKSKRMKDFAHFIMREIDYTLPIGTELVNISRASGRYAMYKVGPVLCVSHGMGRPSITILLHEIIKLLYYAKAKGVYFFRIGTSAGIGIDDGTVVISNKIVDEQLKSTQDIWRLGIQVNQHANIDVKLANELAGFAAADDNYETVIGTTICTTHFYEGGYALDGAICDISRIEKSEYLNKLKQFGGKNMDMESLAFVTITGLVGIRSAVVCVTLNDIMEDNPLNNSAEVYKEWEMRPQKLIGRFIRHRLQSKGQLPLRDR